MLRAETHSPTEAQPLVSVIIPCHRCTDVLRHQLDALTRQALEHPWEVLLVDNGGNNGLEDLLTAYRGRPPNLRLVEATRLRGAGNARNFGAEQARGELLLFADADDQVGEGWLSAMVKALQQHAFVACRMDVDKLNTKEMIRWKGAVQQTGLQPYTYPSFLPHAAGGTLGIRKSIHFQVGGFDTELLRLQDTDYCWRIQLAGYKCHFVPDAVVHYRLRASLRCALKQSFLWGEYNVKLYSLYRSRGMRKITLRQALRVWYHLLRSLPNLFNVQKRARTLRSLAWRLGRLYGSLRYRVFAP